MASETCKSLFKVEMEDSSTSNDSAKANNHVTPAMKTLVKRVLCHVIESTPIHVAKKRAKIQQHAFHREHSTRTRVADEQ